MSAYRRSKFTLGDYPTAGGSAGSAYQSVLAATSSAASLTRPNYATPISSLVNGSTAPCSSISSRISSRYTSSYSGPKLTSTLTASNRPLTSTLITSGASSVSAPMTSSSFTTRNPRLQSYLNARELTDTTSSLRSKPPYVASTSSRSVASRYDPEASRHRSYSHSGLYDGYRSRSSSVRETSPYDPERDRDLVKSMRSQSAMASRANSRDRYAYMDSNDSSSMMYSTLPPKISSLHNDPMFAGILTGAPTSKSREELTSKSHYNDPLLSVKSYNDPLLASKSYNDPMSLGPKSLNDPMLTGSALMSASADISRAAPSVGGLKSRYGNSDEWSDATWLNDLRISAGMDPIPMPATSLASKASMAYEAVSTLPRMLRSNSSHDIRGELERLSKQAGGPVNNPAGRARHQTLAYGVSASDLNMSNSSNSGGSMPRNGSFNDILVARVPSREGEVYDVRGFESDMSAAYMNARSRRHSMDNEIVELHPPLVTFASIEYDGEPLPPVQTAPPPPAPYDHKNNNLVVVNRNDLESILVSKAERNSSATAQKIPNIQRTFVPSNPDNTSEKPSSALQAADVRNTGGSHGADRNDRERDREGRSGDRGGSTAPTNHVGSANEKERGQNGEIDYRKLWEQSQIDNSRLRDELSKTRDELSAAKKKIETVVHAPAPSGGLTDTEKKEKEALVKKLSEMEEELKLLALSENLTDQQLEHLKNDNTRLRDENGALIRVISKLSK